MNSLKTTTTTTATATATATAILLNSSRAKKSECLSHNGTKQKRKLN
jgi:hypothetical protein